jgi:HEAT repeat protein
VEKLRAKGNARGLVKALRYQQDPGVRRAAAEALGRIGDARAVKPLMIALRYARDPDVRTAASKALGQSGAPAVEPLFAALKNPLSGVRSAVVGALAQTGALAVGPLTVALRDRDEGVRRAAMEALAKLYRSSTLDDDHRRRILALDGTLISSKHHDARGSHFDTGSAQGCHHSDFPASHTDETRQLKFTL